MLSFCACVGETIDYHSEFPLDSLTWSASTPSSGDESSVPIKEWLYFCLSETESAVTGHISLGSEFQEAWG